MTKRKYGYDCFQAMRKRRYRPSYDCFRTMRKRRYGYDCLQKT